MAKDYYKILGIERKASKDDIKKAFRKLAHKYHPDKTGGDSEKFKELNEAYQALSDDKRRAEYDTYGQTFNGASGGGTQGFSGFQGFGQGFGAQGFEGMNFDFDLGDVFGDLFNGRGQGGRMRRGSDVSVEIQVSFEEAIFGNERRIAFARHSFCVSCKGTGAKEGTKQITCTRCNGAGKFHETKKSFLGTFTTVRECDVCAGAGKVPEEKCHTCRGAGITRGQAEVSIKIPAGMESGEVIRLTGQGEAVSHGTAGDLYIKVRIAPHSMFRREGPNLTMELNIKLSEALLGSERKIPTLYGEIILKVPEGASFGEVLRVRGKGVPLSGGRHGDLLVHLHIELPKKLSKQVREKIEELKREGM